MKSMAYEQKVEKAKELLEELMQPDITLERGLACFKEGSNVLKEAQEMLEKAKVEYEELKSGERNE